MESPLKTKEQIKYELSMCYFPPSDTPNDVVEQLEKEILILEKQLYSLGYTYNEWEDELVWDHYTEEEQQEIDNSFLEQDQTSNGPTKEEQHEIDHYEFQVQFQSHKPPKPARIIKKEKVIEKQAKSKQVTETITKLDNSFEMFNEPIQLQDNFLHNLLKKSKNYRIFYTLFRLEIYGNYTWIPYLYLIFIQSHGFYSDKFEIKNIKKNGRINLIGFKESGGGKSMLLNFVSNLLEEGFSVSTKVLQNPGTVASLRGTAYTTNTGKQSETDIAYGINSHYFIGFDEIKTLLRSIYKNEDMGGFFLGLMENNYVDAGTIESRKILRAWSKQLKQQSKTKQKLLQDKQKLLQDQSQGASILGLPTSTNISNIPHKNFINQIPLKTRYYQIKTDETNTINEHSTLEFKNNANIIMLGQPITKDAMQVEKNQQLAFGLSTGFYFRSLFIWEKDYYTGDLLQDYKHSMQQFSEKIRTNLNISNINDLKHHLTTELVNSMNKKEKFIYTHDNVSINQLVEKFKLHSPEFIEIENNINKELKFVGSLSGNNKHMLNYLPRMINEFIPYLLYTTAYALNEFKYNDDISIAVIKECGKMLHNFRSYLEEIDTGTKFSKDIQVKDYSTNIIKFIKHLCIKKFDIISNSSNLDLISCYPNRTGFRDKFILYSKLMIGDKFSIRTYNETLQYLEKFGKLKITNHNWIEDKKFPANAYKIILIDDNGEVLDFRKGTRTKESKK